MSVLRKIISFLLSALIFAAPAHGRTVNYSFNRIGGNEGLSSPCVKCILQDHYGFLWIGTKNGINRYDGVTMVRYDCYDSDAMRGNNNIGALYETPDGKLWVGTDRGVYIYDRYLEKFTYLSASDPGGRAPDDWVQDIAADRTGAVWILVPNRGVFCYRSGKIKYYSVTGNDEDKNQRPGALFVTSSGDVYVASSRFGLHRFDPRSDSFRILGNNGAGFPELVRKDLQLIRQGIDGNLCLATQNGNLYHYDVKTGALTVLPFSQSGNVYTRAIECVDNEIWVGTQNGLYIINLMTGREEYITEIIDNPCSLSDNTIYYLYGDREGNMWIGTMFGGISYFQRSGFRFERYTRTGNPASLTSNRLRGIAKGADGNIYVGTEDSGFNIFNPRTGTMTRNDNGNISLVAKTYGKTTYIGYSRAGMAVVEDGKVVGNIMSGLIPDAGFPSSVYSFLVDNKGNRWVGSDWGLFRAEAGSNEFVPVNEVGQAWVFDLYQDSRGVIWIASMGSGVWKYMPSSGRFRYYPYDEKYSNGLRSNSISAITEDSKGNIWLSTDRGGLSRYIPETDNFLTYSLEDGLPDNVVYDVLEDSNGNLWFGTNSGIVRFNPADGTSKTYTTRDGLLSNQFNYHAAAIGDDGYFYMGSMGGLVAFDPQLDLKADTVPPVYFSSLRIASKEVRPGEEGSPLECGMMFAERVCLPYDVPMVTLGISSPSFTQSGTVSLTYRMLPGDSTWTPVKDNYLAFANLAPGSYTLEIRASNGVTDSRRTLRIDILAPWYATWTAILIYILIIALGIAGWIFWYRNYKNKQLREKEQFYKVNKEKELYENKVSFFTELAHEIRTPLSLIDAPLQAIEDLGIGDQRVLRYVKVMKQNTERLLNLTSQLLDFQKIGAEKFDLKFAKTDVTALVNEPLERFEPAMALKDKEVVKAIPSRSIYAVIDSESVVKILSNMFNNALKYSDKYIRVELDADDDCFTVRVTSDGGKISEENSLRIFEPFFQVDNKADNNGVGIGLPLCRTLAHLQHGRIEVEKTEAETNTFILVMPLVQEGVEVAEPDVTESEMDDFILKDEAGARLAELTEQSYSILLVEDNDQMRDFLYDQLSQNFVVETAEDGVVALEKIREHNFDLIVTDIMMPRMDGFELCSAIKEDLNRSHLPVVFLTAKNDLESKLRALKCGGEAYIEKPFSVKYFRQQVISILENRRHERKAFLKQPFFSIDNMKLTAADKEFMDKVMANITDNISDENFSVESMADVFCMSRSSLLRKIKTLFNLSPIELIRTVKLKKAAELIQEGKYRIGDVCYMVGINSPSYFSKLFFKQFGLSPKEFEKQCKNKARSLLADEQSGETNPKQ